MSTHHPSIVTGIRGNALQKYPVSGLAIGKEKMLCRQRLCLCLCCWADSASFFHKELLLSDLPDIVRATRRGKEEWMICVWAMAHQHYQHVCVFCRTSTESSPGTASASLTIEVSASLSYCFTMIWYFRNVEERRIIWLLLWVLSKNLAFVVKCIMSSRICSLQHKF